MGSTAADLLEAWLHELSTALAPRGLNGTLLYDDKFRGDILVLTLPTTEGLTELVAHRAGKGAVLIFVAENARAAQVAASALGGLHHQVSRRANSQRKFVHRIERMVEHLVASFVTRAAAYPGPQLALIQGAVPTAQPMTGVEARFHTKDHEEEPVLEPSSALSARDLRKYVTRFAACIDIGPRKRAVLFESGRFVPRGETAHALRHMRQQRGGDADEGFAAAFAGEALELALIDAPIAAAEGVVAAAAAPSHIIDGLGDAVTSSSSCGDGGFDFAPDCDICDLPDCSF